MISLLEEQEYEICYFENSGSKYIFRAATTTDGNIGGITGADAICNADANIPRAGTYKALLVDGVNRVADPSAGQVDWVFNANACYFRGVDHAVVLQTNKFSTVDFHHGAYGMKNSLVTPLMPQAGSNWTGMTGYSGPNPFQTANDNCSSWTSTTGTGSSGTSYTTYSQAFGGNVNNCTSTFALVCVEQ